MTSVIGKSVGDDFREGKLTLPVLFARDLGDPSDRAFWRRTMSDRVQTDADLATAIRLIRTSGAAERTLEAARAEADAACAALAQAASGPFADELARLADFCVNRAW